MRKTVVSGITAVFLLLNPLSYAQEQVLDSTAAVVDNQIILESELDAFQKLILARNPKIDALTARKAALEELITRSVIVQQAIAQGADLNDTQLDNALNQIAMKNNTSPENILNSFGKGLSTAEKRELFKQEVLIGEYRNSRVRSRLHASDTEIEALANTLKNQGSVEPRYHLSQIVIPLSANPTRDEYINSQARARDVVAKAKNGADFNALALQYAHGADASQAGDLGYMPESQVPLPFVPALTKAKPGDIIGPFRSPMGLHILKVHDITHDAVTPIKTYSAAHILIKTSIIFADDAAKAKLDTIREDILAGKISFEEAARKFSEDPGSAVDGGNLGYSVPDRYDPAFARVLVSLREGQISEPFKSSFGWHIIKLNDIKVDSSSQDAYKDRARAIILERKFKEESAQWEKELRDQAYIHVTDPVLLEAGVNLDQNKR